jgi:ABC-2 type transport system ATP-binding protein
MPPLLEVKKLVKHYNDIKAVNGVSFSIQPGTCFGLLGPNGAGKTTTIEVIEDIIRPTSGEIFYKGKPRSTNFGAQIGIQFQQTSLLSFLTVSETLKTFSELYAVTYDLQELIQLCRLEDFLHQYNDRISGGQQQRFMLALALLNKPELVFLDEPSTGLDPQARRNLWTIIQNIKTDGQTIVLTTHYMEEAEQLCDEIAVMDYGKIIARGSPGELIKQYCHDVTVAIPSKSVTQSLHGSGMDFHQRNGRIEINTDDLNKCMKELINRGVDLAEMTVRSPNLEDVFLNLTGRQLRD